jgi:hypothetical protein
VLLPALRARSSPPKPRLFPIAPWPARPCDPVSPIYPPANRENPQPRSSNHAAPIRVLQALSAPSSFAAQIPAGCAPCLSPNHALPATDLGAAKPVAVSAAGMPGNCSSGIYPTSGSHNPRSYRIQVHVITRRAQIARRTPIDQLRLITSAKEMTPVTMSPIESLQVPRSHFIPSDRFGGGVSITR